MTTTTESAPLTACPSWCTLPTGHRWDSIHDDGIRSREHQGPQFGEHVSAGGTERHDTPGVQYVNIYVSDEVTEHLIDASEALLLARNLIDAAHWVIAGAPA